MFFTRDAFFPIADLDFVPEGLVDEAVPVGLGGGHRLLPGLADPGYVALAMLRVAAGGPHAGPHGVVAPSSPARPLSLAASHQKLIGETFAWLPRVFRV